MIGHIRLNVTNIDNFCKNANTFKSDINIGEGNRLIDAKSLLGLVTLDFSEDVKLEIITDDENEKRRFKDLLRIYGGKVD